MLLPRRASGVPGRRAAVAERAGSAVRLH